MSRVLRTAIRRFVRIFLNEESLLHLAAGCLDRGDAQFGELTRALHRSTAVYQLTELIKVLYRIVAQQTKPAYRNSIVIRTGPTLECDVRQNPFGKRGGLRIANNMLDFGDPIPSSHATRDRSDPASKHAG